MARRRSQYLTSLSLVTSMLTRCACARSACCPGGSFKAVNETFVEHWVGNEECGANLLQLEGPDGNVRNCEGEDAVVYNLFAFPAEDNFAGVWHMLVCCPAYRVCVLETVCWTVCLTGVLGCTVWWLVQILRQLYVVCLVMVPSSNHQQGQHHKADTAELWQYSKLEAATMPASLVHQQRCEGYALSTAHPLACCHPLLVNSLILFVTPCLAISCYCCHRCEVPSGLDPADQVKEH